MKYLNLLTAALLLILLLGCNATSPKWQVKIGARDNSRIDAPVTVNNGLVYVAAMDLVPGLYPWGEAHYLQALDAKDGKFKWHSALGGYTATTPVVSNGIVYIVSIGSGLYALDAIDGKLQWFFPGIDRPASTPVVYDGVIYLAFKGENQINPDGPLETKLAAIESESGELSWSIPLEKTSEPTLAPLVTSEVIYFVDGPELYTADLNTGAKKLRFRTENDFVTEPVLLDDGNIYISSYSDFIVIKADTGSKQWNLTIPEGFVNSMHISQGVVYLSSIVDLNPHSGGKGYLVAIDLRTQKELWHFNFNSSISSLAGDRDILYFSSGSEIRGLDKTTGKEVWRFKANRMMEAPLLVEGILYIGDWDGYLYAVPATAKVAGE
jgi:eukaryotic-like serine/threonine-protein kinase